VLTDGRLLLGDDGREFRSFDVKDGFGIRALTLSGIKVAVISGRESEVVKRRCENLGIEDVCQKVMKKHEVLEELVKKYGIDAGEACFIGDDVNDVAVLKKVGLSVCVADASPELKSVCDLVTTRPGGRGAVREIAEMILKAQGRWEAIVAEFS
jgi:3-deoxy-D-manno-octulosonate 8-phosphate phosphatase (KDO 8-P phosphatase)